MNLEFEKNAPQVHPTAFVAPGAILIGRVQVGAEASIWYNCVVRADVKPITIGARSNIQDGTVIHVASAKGAHPGCPPSNGVEGLVGDMAMIHGCTLHDRAFVGLGAIVMDGCEIEGHGMLAAGAMLTPGKV